MAQDPYKYFRIEARELTEQLARNALELEKSAQPAAVVARLLRFAHTLKGAARVVKQREIADAAHTIEDVLAPHRDATGDVPRESVDAILQLIDRISTLAAALAPAAEQPAGAPEQQPPREESPRSVRADMEEMDALLDGLAEIHSQLSGVRQAAQSLDRARQITNLLSEQIAAPRRKAGPQANAGATLARAAPLAEELQELIGGLERKLTGGVEQIDREIRQTRDVAERLRLLPVGSVFDALERTARDSAQALGKRVRFDAAGRDVRLDAHVLGILQGALVQLVRNAIAHGIESDLERRAAAKPAEGLIRVEVLRRGKQVAFVCRDDGRGIDVEGIRAIAVRKGNAGAQHLAPGELLQLLFKGGISTSGTVTEMSGRGVGLDVVRETLERLGGNVRVETEAGRGTTVELTVPVSLSSLDALIVEAAGVRAALPLDKILRAQRSTREDVVRTPAGESVLYEEQTIPYIDLGRYLAAPGHDFPAAGLSSSVVMRVDGALAAIGVDRLLGIENVVLRTLPAFAPADPIVAGASLDAEGNPQLVLDAEGLSARLRRGDAIAQEPSVRRLPILIIDDSPTTRMLEQSILEAAGYQADVASSAEEALDKARSRAYGLFLVDVEMPGMDGFTFVERTRAEAELRGIPAILVTSRNSPEDLKRGRDAGAYGYIVKSEFDQVELLDQIRKAMA